MDKKKMVRSLGPDDVKGFEDFIEGQPTDSHFLPRGFGGGTKKSDVGFEHFTFLSNDGIRLQKLKELLSEKLPFSSKFDQGDKLIKEQKEEINILKKKIFVELDKEGSPYRKSLEEVFNAFFEQPKI